MHNTELKAAVSSATPRAECIRKFNMLQGCGTSGERASSITEKHYARRISSSSSSQRRRERPPQMRALHLWTQRNVLYICRHSLSLSHGAIEVCISAIEPAPSFSPFSFGCWCWCVLFVSLFRPQATPRHNATFGLQKQTQTQTVNV